MSSQYRDKYLTAWDADNLVTSIISKMMYTCHNPYCKHRLAGGYSFAARSVREAQNINKQRNTDKKAKQYRKQKKYYQNNSDQKQRNTCDCYEDEGVNPEQQNWGQRSRNRSCFSQYTGTFCPCIKPAGNYQREQDRGRIINNSLHDGSRTKNIIYDSQNPEAQIKNGPFAKNYDDQYEKYENRVRRTVAPTPGAQTKIGTLVRRDRLKSNYN